MENRLREKDEEIENIRWVNMALYQQAKRDSLHCINIENRMREKDETENIRGV